jgi:hypothetical protein
MSGSRSTISKIRDDRTDISEAIEGEDQTVEEEEEKEIELPKVL